MATGDLTLSATGYTSVKVWTTKISHNVDKPFKDLQQPDLDGTKSTTEKTLLIDLGRIKEVITVQGYLVDESAEPALTKKDNILLMVRKQGVPITATWGTTSKSMEGQINKVMFEETPGIIADDGQPANSDEKNISITFSLIAGTNIVE